MISFKTLQAYRSIALPLSANISGVITFPYSGIHFNPPFRKDTPPMCRGPVQGLHAYDIGGTLVDTTERDRTLEALFSLSDGGVRENLFRNPELTRLISNAQELGILSGDINTPPCDGATEQLERERTEGYGILALTVGTYAMARSMLYGAKLLPKVDGLVTTEELIDAEFDPTQKTQRMFELIGRTLAVYHGQTFKSYTDNSLDDARAAIAARETLAREYGRNAHFPIYLVHPTATDDELGETDFGAVVIRRITEKGERDNKTSSYTLGEHHAN